MPDAVDRDLRDRLTAAAEVVEPDLNALLPAATARGAAHRRRRRTAGMIAATVVVGGTLAGVTVALAHRGDGPKDTVRVVHRPPSPHPSNAPSSPPAQPVPAAAHLTGTFTRTVPADTGPVAQDRLAGRWTLHLHRDGSVGITPPPGFRSGEHGVAYALFGTRIRMDLFQRDVCKGSPLGYYRWTRTSHGVRFDPSGDVCGARYAVLVGLWSSS